MSINQGFSIYSAQFLVSSLFCVCISVIVALDCWDLSTAGDRRENLAA